MSKQILRSFQDLRMTENICRHTEALAEVSFNIDPETSGFCVVRSDSADTKEQKVRRTTTKCSEQRLFVKQNPRQFRVTVIYLSFRTRFGICLFAEFTKYCRNRFFGRCCLGFSGSRFSWLHFQTSSLSFRRKSPTYEFARFARLHSTENSPEWRRITDPAST